MVDRGVVKKEQIVTIYKSKTFPTTGYGYVYNLKPDLAKKVQEAFLTFPWKGTELEKECSKQGVSKFTPITACRRRSSTSPVRLPSRSW